MDRSSFRKTALLSGFLLASLACLPACTSDLERYRKDGVSLYNQKKYDESLVSLNTALALDQSDSQSNTYAGLIHYRAGEYEQAAYHLKLALQLDPSSDEAKDGLVATYVKLNEPDMALDALERAAKLADHTEDPRLERLDWKHVYKKNIQERLYLGRADDRLRIGHAYETLGDYDNAQTYYQKALVYAPEHPVILMALATLAEKAQNPAAAREYLTRVFNADPATPGLTAAMTRNNLAITDITGAPPHKTPEVPAPKP